MISVSWVPLNYTFRLANLRKLNCHPSWAGGSDRDESSLLSGGHLAGPCFSGSGWGVRLDTQDLSPDSWTPSPRFKHTHPLRLVVCIRHVSLTWVDLANRSVVSGCRQWWREGGSDFRAWGTFAVLSFKALLFIFVGGYLCTHLFIAHSRIHFIFQIGKLASGQYFNHLGY